MIAMITIIAVAATAIAIIESSAATIVVAIHRPGPTVVTLQPVIATEKLRG